jgi:protoporphyrinogen oxidase
MQRIGIIGAGISGLSLAKRLLQLGIKSTIYEKQDDIGGLCRTKIINENVFDISGGHVFNTKFDDVKKWVFDLLDKESWQYSERKAKILYEGKLIDYPFEFSLAQLDIDETIECLIDFIGLCKKRKKTEPNNFYDWIIWAFGNSMAKKYMLPYNKKIWNYNLKDISIDWIKGKMPIPTLKQIVTSLIKKDFKENFMPHSTFYYPKKGGIKTLIEAIASGLNDIRTNEPVLSIEILNKKFIINGQETYDVIINTAPLKELIGVIKGMPEDIKNAINDLKYNSLKIVLFESQRDNDFSWVYLPDENIKPHRLVYQGNFSVYNTPHKNKSSIAVEVIGEYPIKLIINDLEKYYELKNPIAEHFTEYAYIIYDKKRKKNMEKIKRYFDYLGIKLLGRFAEWEYPNMDLCIKKSMTLASEVVKLIS